MASTKEMQARAKARKQSTKIQTESFNETKMIEILVCLGKVIIAENPAQDYDQTSDSHTAAVMTVEHYGLGVKHFEQMLEFREKYNNAINKHYNIELVTGAGAFMQDVQATLTQGGVPQSQRIELGLLDTIIGVMAMRNGSVKFI